MWDASVLAYVGIAGSGVFVFSIVIRWWVPKRGRRRTERARPGMFQPKWYEGSSGRDDSPQRAASDPPRRTEPDDSGWFTALHSRIFSGDGVSHHDPGHHDPGHGGDGSDAGGHCGGSDGSCGGSCGGDD